MRYYTVNGMTGTIGQLCLKYKMSENTVRDRLKKGYPIERALSKERIQRGASADVEKKMEEQRQNRPETPAWDLKACRRLGMKAVLQAYVDVCNMLATDMAFVVSDEDATRPLRDRKRVVLNRAKEVQAQYYRSLVRSQKRADFTRTVPQLKPMDECIQEVLNDIRKKGLNSRSFLESDRLCIFTDYDGRYLLDTARKQVNLWAKGKIPSYHCRFSTIGCEIQKGVEE